MEYQDEKIAELKKQLRRQKYTDIKGEGVFINNQLVKFGARTVNDRVELYIPEAFIDMPEEIKLMKYPSVSRPQCIYTSLDGSVNFAFSLIDQSTPDSQVVSLTAQMMEVIHKSNPAAVFDQEASELLVSGHPICMFDFKSYGIDEQMYNMSCFTPLSSGTLHCTFSCVDGDSEDWKDVAWKAFKTIREINAEA